MSELLNSKRTLQALAFWYGYQKQRFPHLALREIAIAHELAALMLAQMKSTSKVVLEKSYRDLISKKLLKPSLNESREKFSKQSLDLYVETINKEGGVEINCVEIKRLAKNAKEIEGDVKKLSIFKRKKEFYTWVIVCGEGELPRKAFGQNVSWVKKGKNEIAKGTQFPITSLNGSIYCVRRIYSASSAKLKSNKSNYVVLLEVVR